MNLHGTKLDHASSRKESPIPGIGPSGSHAAAAGHAPSSLGNAKGHAQSHGEEEGEGEPWLLSYADMVTLLMCFFILFFTLDKSKGGVSDPTRVSKRLAQVVALDVSTSGGIQGGASWEDTKNGVSSELYKMSTSLRVVFALSQPTPETLLITFLSSGFFKSGSTELSSDALVALEKIAQKIKLLDKVGLGIDVEGHTDSAAIGGNQLFPSNWELSANRAGAVVRQLIAFGVPSHLLKASGFADQKPLVKERDSSGRIDPSAQSLNRRVEIKIKKDLKGQQVKKIDPKK